MFELDAMETLREFQKNVEDAVINGIPLKPIEEGEDIHLAQDPDESLNFFFLDGLTVKGLCFYKKGVLAENSFSITYAVHKDYRVKGVCNELLYKSLEIMKRDFPSFFIEAFVPYDNKVSQKVAAKFFGKGYVTPYGVVFGKEAIKRVKEIERNG